MAMMVFGRGALAMGVLVMGLAGSAGAQENLDSGKSPAQLFASDCAICHKTPQGLAKAAGLFGLDNFLREHYTASRESAAALSRYIQSVDRGPAAPARPVKRTAKGSDKTKGAEKKPAGEPKPGEKPAEAKTAEPKAIESNTAEPKAAEPKPAEAKPAEAEPAESPKAN